MSFFWLLSIAIQVYFVVHVLKKGRDRWWVWIIIIFPGVGCAAYFIVEFLPDLKQRRAFRRTSAGKIVKPGKQLRQLKDQLARSDSVKNKKVLAEGYMEAGMYAEAVSLYEECLQGIYENDPYLLDGLSRAYFQSKDFEAAKQALLKLKEIWANKQSHEFNLLLARTHEELGEIAAALEAYSSLARQYPGEEARCRYGLLLKKEGKQEEAKKIFEDVVREAMLSPKYYRRTEKKWIGIAKKGI